MNQIFFVVFFQRIIRTKIREIDFKKMMISNNDDVFKDDMLLKSKSKGIIGYLF